MALLAGNQFVVGWPRHLTSASTPSTLLGPAVVDAEDDAPDNQQQGNGGHAAIGSMAQLGVHRPPKYVDVVHGCQTTKPEADN
jgi:hypothetical protein